MGWTTYSVCVVSVYGSCLCLRELFVYWALLVYRGL